MAAVLRCEQAAWKARQKMYGSLRMPLQRWRPMNMPGYDVGIEPTLMEIRHFRKSNNSDFCVRRFLTWKNKARLPLLPWRASMDWWRPQPSGVHCRTAGGYLPKDRLFVKTGALPLQSDFHEIMPDGESRQIGVVTEIQFLENSKTIGVHRFDADVVGFSDFPVRLTHGETPQNLNFPLG